MSSSPGLYPPELSKEETENLVSTIKDWSIAHGLAVRPPPSLIPAETDPHNVLATTAPVTLFPSPFPKVCFEQATAIQKSYNELYAAIAQDEDFLKDIVEELIEADEFIAKLWDVHLEVKTEGYVQHLSLGLFRSDYMVHQEVDKPDSVPVVKQVEFNTIAASFGGLSYQTSQLHKYLSSGSYPDSCNPRMNTATLPVNTSTQSLAAGLRVAYNTYLKERPSKANPTCVIFLVQSPERNIFDQRHLEYTLQYPGHDASHAPIPVFRLPFSEILEHTVVSQDASRDLLYSPPHNPSKIYEVAVVYFRAGYDPSDYPTSTAWSARLQIERSNAIKCPSILTQLAGAKKVQQVLATPTNPSTPSILNRFLKDSDLKRLNSLEGTFTNIYPLDTTPAGLSARKIATDPIRCQNYVLKPQREGGGNNIYRSSVPPFLASIPESHWKSYILMELITPPPVQNIILRNGLVEKGGVICELGIYGTCLWDGRTGDVIDSGESTGYLLRTKGDKSEEGGVAAGFGAMDSCLLV